MYEKSSPTSLEALVGLEVSAIHFVRDYISISFEDVGLTCYTLPVIYVSGRKIAATERDYKDSLCDLIGHFVHSVKDKPRSELYIEFDNDICITISLRSEDARGPEAAMIIKKNSDIFDVWQYE